MLASFTSNPRVPCPPGQVLKRLLGRLMSGCALLLCVGFSGAALADDFDELIRRLGNDNWEERDAAERAIKKIALTKAQFARLAEAANTSGDAEIRFRASEIVKAKIREVAPSIDKIADLVEVRQGDRTLEVQVEGTTSYFDFRFDSLYARSPAQRPALNGIVSLVDAAGSALMRGDPREASRQLQALETYLRAMTDAEWGAFFDARLERASREDAIAKVQAAIGLIPAVQSELDVNGPPMPVDSIRIPVPEGGNIDLGRTLYLTLNTLLKPGVLEVSPRPIADATLFLPGFTSVGELSVFDLTAREGLQPLGTVNLGIAFDAGLVDPGQLRVARLASLEIEILVPQVDLGRQIAFVSYDAPSAGGDPLGEFRLVRLIPEPGSFLLCGLGLLAIPLLGGLRKPARCTEAIGRSAAGGEVTIPATGLC